MTDQPESSAVPEGEEREWWDDPAMPWRKKPERADYLCLGAMSVVGVYALVMLPLRPVLLGLAPQVLGSLGYRTGIIMSGALAAVGDMWWPLVWVLGALMMIKFDWIYWWAGRRWGRAMLDTLTKDKSARTKARYEKIWKFTSRYEKLAIVVTFLPIPIPSGVVYAALGAAGTSLKTFLTMCAVSAGVLTGAYLWLGYAIGEPAVQLMESYGKFMWIISIILIVGMIGVAIWRAKKNGQRSDSGQPAS